jgi:hypothetical protein
MDYSKADGQPAKCPARPKPSGVIAPRMSELGQSRRSDRARLTSVLAGQDRKYRATLRALLADNDYDADWISPAFVDQDIAAH